MFSVRPGSSPRRASGKRAVAGVLALVLGFYAAGAVVSTADRAYAGPLVIPALGAAAAGVPLSVVSAGVGGGVTLLSTGPALASAGLTAAAALAGNWAVSALFTWRDDTPANLGVKPSTSAQVAPGYAFAGPHNESCASTGWLNYATWTAPSTGDNAYFLYRDPGTGRDTYRFGGDLWPRCGLGNAGNGGDVAGHLVALKVVNSAGEIGVWWGAEADRKLLDAQFGTSSTANLQPVAEAPPEPLTITPQRTCSDGSTVTGTPSKTTRSTASGALTWPACPAGTVPTGASAPVTRDSDGVKVAEAIDPWTPPVVPAAYPDCATYACVMTLTRTLPDGQVITCARAGQCSSYADVVKQWPQIGAGASTVPRQAPDGSSYACRFGPYPVAVAECQVIPGAGLAAPAQTASSGCALTDFSLNPVSWVVVPMRCLWVPTTVGAQMTALRADVASKPPGSVVLWGSGAVPAMAGGWSGARSCAALPDFDPDQKGRLRLPCAPDNKAFRVGHALVGLFIGSLAALKLWHMAETALGGGAAAGAE